MRVTVVHNPAAGADIVTAEALLAELHAAGHEPVYASTGNSDWQGQVQDPGDLVLAAGGDGTVGQVARWLMGRVDVPLAILPLGTANNIATALGVAGAWRELVDGLSSFRESRLTMGMVSGPWGDRLFLEGVGFGLVPEVMARAAAAAPPAEPDVHGDGELRRDLALVRTTLSSLLARRCVVYIDGQRLERDALIAAVMRLPAAGPRLVFAPAARPADDALHLVIARAADREQIDAWIEGYQEGAVVPSSLEVHRASIVEIQWPDSMAHVDDMLWQGEDRPVRARMHMHPQALRVLVPASSS
jgi:diacylglycerol kinase (ATP)